MDPREIAPYIDHTLLKPQAGQKDYKKLCWEALEYGFATVCVLPNYVELCAKLLKASPVGLATVIGFPLGATYSQVKLKEAQLAIARGATELDMVMNFSAALDGHWDILLEDIEGLVTETPDIPVKVIIETAYLKDEQIRKASQLILASGAKYVKTSTGFGPRGASVADVKLIKEVVGTQIGIKASGGIRTFASALELIKAGASRLGTSSGLNIIGVKAD